VGRTPGVKNHDHDERKRLLARKILKVVVETGGHPSLQRLARDTGSSIPTIKHYFGDRSGAVAEALRTVREDAHQQFRAIASPGRAKLARSLQTMVVGLVDAWTRFGVGPLFAAGLSAGLLDDTTGPGYVDGVLEPTVRALEARLTVHARRGELDLEPGDEEGIRAAALTLLSPILVALLHQNDLAGRRCRPLDIDAFVKLHLERFIRAYGRPERA
jgi:AcrR family transcriptional regulator